ncbi:hypothetical protein [Nannocystis pusilla]|uniref:hypothetical protein n=1 Tax=Nannocystis pusilla TaxID=889268 RepID=UPI003B7AF993
MNSCGTSCGWMTPVLVSTFSSSEALTTEFASWAALVAQEKVLTTPWLKSAELRASSPAVPSRQANRPDSCWVTSPSVV